MPSCSSDASPTAVHDLVCEFVTAQAEAEASGGWTGYRDVFLSAEVQNLIRSRLAGAASPAESPGGAADSSSGGPHSPKNSKAPAVTDAAADAVSWTICCCDGATFSVTLPDHARVAEAKRAIGVLREVAHFAMELFVEGEEEPLDDEKRLNSADKVPLFMLPKEASDRLALEALFKSCGGADWKRKGGWMTDADLGEWQGVTVDVEGRVVKLHLYENNVAGALPGGIQQLSALTMLNLHGNKLTGAIPAELGQLEALRWLWLGRNKLAGPIPAELGQLGALIELDLASNMLTGPIPTELLGQLGALKKAHLAYNQFSAAIPTELAQLPCILYLDMLGYTTGEGAFYLDVQPNQLSTQEAFRRRMQEHNPDCKLLLVEEDDESEDSAALADFLVTQYLEAF
jgi:hypothetical protein